MKIRNESNFTPCPDGVHNAVLVDVVDLGMCDTQFGPKHKLTLVWQVEEKMESGKPFLVSKRYGASLHKRSTLRKDLKSWRGRDFTDEEAKEFELDDLVGVNAQLVIEHNEHEGTIYANVIAITKGKTKLVGQSYIRKKDREDYVAPSTPLTAKPVAVNKKEEDDGGQIPF